MSDEKGAAGSAQRLTEVAQRLNQLNATRYLAMAAENPTQLPPHLIEKKAGTIISPENLMKIAE